MANPWGDQWLSIRTLFRQLETQTRPNTEPHGELELISVVANPWKGGPMALYQNTVSIHF